MSFFLFELQVIAKCQRSRLPKRFREAHMTELCCYCVLFCSVSPDCPADSRTWVPFQDRCYHFVHGQEDSIKSYTFERARTLCRGFGTCETLHIHFASFIWGHVEVFFLSVLSLTALFHALFLHLQSSCPSRAPRRMTLSLNTVHRCGRATSTCGWECIMIRTVSTVTV